MGRRIQTLWKEGLELCFKADSLFSRCNHRNYKGHNREIQDMSLWHREMAVRFCTDELWEDLRENARDEEARSTVETLRAEHQGHRLFLHHTMESLLYVANIILPFLQKALQQAGKMLKRWSWLPWIPNPFVLHYETYLTSTQAKLDDIQSQLTQAIRARVKLVLQSLDGKSGDVIMALVSKLRQEVPGFIPDERLEASETPRKKSTGFTGHNPATIRQATSKQLAQAVQYLYQCDETRAFVPDYVEEVNAVDDPIWSLSVKEDESRLLLVPSTWQCENTVSWGDIVKAYPWCRHWTLREGLALLQSQTRVKALRDDAIKIDLRSTDDVIAAFDRITSIIAATKQLARYQTQVSKYRPKSFWFRFFAKWEKTAQYQTWRLQKQQLNRAMKQIQCQQAQSIIHYAPYLIENANAYSSLQWTQIIKVVQSVTLPRLSAQILKGDRDPQIIALQSAYERLRIAGSPFLAGKEKTVSVTEDELKSREKVPRYQSKTCKPTSSSSSHEVIPPNPIKLYKSH